MAKLKVRIQLCSFKLNIIYALFRKKEQTSVNNFFNAFINIYMFLWCLQIQTR